MSSPDRADEVDRWIEETVHRALAYAITLVRNRADAEDIVQDCYGRLLARSEQYDLPRDGSKLLFKAIANACINHVQRRPPTVQLEIAAGAAGPDRLSLADRSEAVPDRRAMRREFEEAIAAALAELPVTQRAVLELRILGHSLIEVAEMLEMSHANARTVLHRARRTLAARLRPFLEDDVA